MVTPVFAQSQDPVDLRANSLHHNEKTQTIIAKGDVMMVQADRILRADQVLYDLKSDTVTASGNVVLNDPTGDVHFSQEVQFNDRLKNGFVRGLKSYLADGAQFTAEKGLYENGDVVTMKSARYTPCELCEDDPDSDPVWQIKAAEVVHNQGERRVKYKHARFEAFGVPVLYTPYFSHPDGTIERKSGLLGPIIGYKSDLGAIYGQQYYIDLAPNKDMTIGAIGMSKESPLIFGQWRQRFENAQLEINGGAIEAERVDRSAGLEVLQEEEWRGHVMANGRWDMTQNWRSGFDVEWVTDDQYVRQFDFDELKLSDEDVLTSQVYAERFSGRDYFSGRLITFQDVRVRDEQEEQPEVLPEIMASFKGEPGALPLIKGQWTLDTSFLGLQRAGDEQDMNRLSVNGGWQRRMVSDYGLVSNIYTSVRGDLYNTRDREVAFTGSGQDDTISETRIFPSVTWENSYPMAKEVADGQVTIEPIVALTAASNIDVNNDIPNEDSKDVQIDVGNLFEPNRFPGYDRIEDKSKVTYGVRTGVYNYDGDKTTFFLGQSYRLDDDDNPFAEGSGLNEQESDVVGQITGFYQNALNFDYRFQLGGRDLSSQRHEFETSASWDRLDLSGRYLYARALEGTDIDENREQIQANGAYYFSEDWRMRSGATYDLGDQPGLRRAFWGVDYLGQCVSLSLTGQRSLTDDTTGDSDNEIMLRVGLKNLGQFETSRLRVDRAPE